MRCQATVMMTMAMAIAMTMPLSNQLHLSN
jgi:hypothetical protein